jgi:hypothetical protein
LDEGIQVDQPALEDEVAVVRLPGRDLVIDGSDEHLPIPSAIIHLAQNPGQLQMGSLWKNVVEQDDAEVQEVAGRVKRE